LRRKQQFTLDQLRQFRRFCTLSVISTIMEPLRGSFFSNPTSRVFYTKKSCNETSTPAGSDYCRIKTYNRIPVQLPMLIKEKSLHGPEKKSLIILSGKRLKPFHKPREMQINFASKIISLSKFFIVSGFFYI